MGRLRQEYQEFVKRGAEVIALGPDGPAAFKRFWEQNDMPFVGLADPKSKTAEIYQQQVNLLKLGRMPAIFIIDRAGMIRYFHFGKSMADIPDNTEVLDILDRMSADATTDG